MKKMAVMMLIIVLVVVAILIFIRRNEDSWVKDEKGVYIKHGVSIETPQEVSEQQNAVNCALQLFHNAKNSGMNFSSQCLGTCGNYAVDVVHAPRTAEDNQIENQCADFRDEKVSKFIELDKNGEIVKIA